MKKFKKLLAMGLAVMASVSAMSMSAFADYERPTIENAKVITQQTSDGGSITVTYNPKYEVGLPNENELVMPLIDSVYLDNMVSPVGSMVVNVNGVIEYHDTYELNNSNPLFSPKKYKYASGRMMRPVVVPENRQSVSVEVFAQNPSDTTDTELVAYVDLNNTSSRAPINITNPDYSKNYYFKIYRTADTNAEGYIDIY